MALTSATRSVSYTGNGSTTAYPVPFLFFAAGDLVVKVDGATKTLGTDYSVTGAADPDGGTVTLTAAAGASITIERVVALTQPTSLRTQGSFSPALHEDMNDRAMMAAQQIDAAVTTAQADADALDGRLTTAEGDITSLEGRTSDLEAQDVAQNASRAALAVRVTNLETGETALQSRATATEAKDAAQDAQLASLAGGLVPSDVLLRWPLAKASNWFSRTSGVAVKLYGVAYGAGVFVAVGGDGASAPVILYSRDGATWTQAANPAGIPATSPLQSIAFANGSFLAAGGVAGVLGSDAVLVTSLDGVTWTAGTASGAHDNQAIAYGGGLWVAGGCSEDGASGAISTSPDGATWTDRVQAADGHGVVRAIAYSGTHFAAVCFNGDILYSEDGTTWTGTSVAGVTSLSGVAAGAGTFVAVGPGSAVLVDPSGTGQDWEDQSGTVGTADLQAVTYDAEGVFTAVGLAGVVAASNDPAQMIRRPTGSAADLHGATVGGGCIVGVGGGGAILQSLTIPTAV